MKKRSTILIVDDMAMMRMTLHNLLQDSYSLLEAVNGADALDMINFYSNELNLVLLDVVMPTVDGLQVLAQMKKKKLLSHIPVMLITAEESAKVITLGFDLGASDVIQKPFNPLVVKRHIQNLLELYDYKANLEKMVTAQTAKLMEQAQQLTAQARSITQAKDVVLNTLSAVIEYRDLESGQHIHRIRAYTRLLLEVLARSGQKFDSAQIDRISEASALHDVGKIAIPDSVLLKPGYLTPAEFEIMKTHTLRACEILNHLADIDDKLYLAYCYEICLSHHERWDGGGYPNGLRGDMIPLSAQVVSLADVYDALTTRRVYKPAYSHEVAMQMVLDGKCGAFSPAMLHIFQIAAPQMLELSQVYRDSDGKTAGSRE